MGRAGAGRSGNDTVEKGSALVGLLVSLLILVGLAGATFAMFARGTESNHRGPAPAAPPSITDTVQRAVDAVELAQVQTAANAYAAINGTIPPDPEALVRGGELESAPRCALVIDPSTGVVGYRARQVDPTCHP
jgi:hypothetical protein